MSWSGEGEEVLGWEDESFHYSVSIILSFIINNTNSSSTTPPPRTLNRNHNSSPTDPSQPKTTTPTHPLTQPNPTQPNQHQQHFRWEGDNTTIKNDNSIPANTMPTAKSQTTTMMMMGSWEGGREIGGRKEP